MTGVQTCALPIYAGPDEIVNLARMDGGQQAAVFVFDTLDIGEQDQLDRLQLRGNGPGHQVGVDIIGPAVLEIGRASCRERV